MIVLLVSCGRANAAPKSLFAPTSNMAKASSKLPVIRIRYCRFGWWRKEAQEEDIHQTKEDQAQEGEACCTQVLQGGLQRQGDKAAS